MLIRFFAYIPIICLIIGTKAMAQDNESSMSFPIDDETGKVTYEEVVKEDGVSKEKLYDRAHQWFQSYFTNASGVIDKKEDGKGIWGQDRFFLWDKDGGQKRRAGLIKYDIDIQVKEGRYKYKITEIFKQQSPRLFINEWVNYEGDNKKQYNAYLEQIHKKITDLKEDMKGTMSESLEEDSEDDW